MNTGCDVIVVGAGLAGATAAYALASRGLQVTIIEKEARLAAKASGNPRAILLPYIGSSESVMSKLYRAGHELAWTSLADVACDLFSATGALQLPSTPRIAKLFADPLGLPAGVRLLSPSEASGCAGVSVSHSALYVTKAGTIDPSLLVQRLLDSSGDKAKVLLSCGMTTLEPNSARWTVRTSDGRSLEAPFVVLAAAHETSMLDCAGWLPLEPVRGETLLLSGSEQSKRISLPICYDGYICPAEGETHFVGASYKHDDARTDPDPANARDMVKRLEEWLPGLGISTVAVKSSRVCFRTSTFDRLPFSGQLPDVEWMSREAAKYRSGTDLDDKVPLRSLDGLYSSVGHGSRGLTTCFLSAELIARQILREPLAGFESVSRIVDPARFARRAMQRTSALRRG